MSSKRKDIVLRIIYFGSFSVITALRCFFVRERPTAEANTFFVLGGMVIVAAIEMKVAVIAVNLSERSPSSLP
jgi:hypothetical protein